MLALREDKARRIRDQGAYRGGKREFAGTRLREGQGLGGRVVASGEPLLVGDYVGEYTDSPFLQIIKLTSMKSFVAVPSSLTTR